MLETLAIVAYRQPITRPEIDEIRGVDCGPVLKTLLDRGLVRMIGKKEEVGRPMLYGTTPEFLRTFSLRDLSELPTLREFHELGPRRDGQGGRDRRRPGAPTCRGRAGRGAIRARDRRCRPSPREDDALFDELERRRRRPPLGAARPMPDDAAESAPPTTERSSLARMRLQQFLAQAGVSSRREAEALIASGSVTRQRRGGERPLGTQRQSGQGPGGGRRPAACTPRRPSTA